MTYNAARFEALLMIALESASAALPALSETTRNAGDLARAEHSEALRLSPLVSSDLGDMPALVQALAAEHARLLEDPQHNPNHEMRTRSALTAARRAVAAESRAAALTAETARRAAEIRPLQVLVLACKRYVGENHISLMVPSR